VPYSTPYVSVYFQHTNYATNILAVIQITMFGMAGGRVELPAGAAGLHGLGHGTVQHPHRRTRLRQGPHEQLG